MTGAQTLDLAFAGSAFENSLKFWTIARGENFRPGPLGKNRD